MKNLLLAFFMFYSILAGQKLPEEINSLHPIPGSNYHIPETNIMVRFKSPIKYSPLQLQELFKVISPAGLEIEGGVYYSTDNKTIIFDPVNNFGFGERITVKLNIHQKSDFEYSFEVRQKTSGITENKNDINLKNSAHISADINKDESGNVRIINGVSVPSDFPEINITTNTGGADEGRIFFGLRNNYIIILEDDGTPYFYQKSKDFLMDFKVLPNGLLSKTVDDGENHFFITMNNNFEVVDTFTVSPSYITDHHDFLMLDNGHALLIARDYVTVDMSLLVPGGNPNATVMACHIQELDLNKNVVWEWRSWDHIPITDAVNENLTAAFIDFVHMNAIALDVDNNLVASCRNLSACIKIDRETGEILWYLGGVNNSFEYIGDDDMNSYQHMFKPVPGKENYYTLFDNGNYHSPRYTRGLEVKIDTSAMTAEKVWEFRTSPDRQSRWLGGVHRLPNGNSLINWATNGQPFATEVNLNGEIVYEAQTAKNMESYRSYRFNWSGMSLKPYLLIEEFGSVITLIFNQFGKDDIAHYKIYRGNSPDSLELVDATTSTSYDEDTLENQVDYYWRVSAVDKSGSEGELSNLEHVFTNFHNIGDNIIQNGNFNDGMDHWGEYFESPAEAVSSIVSSNLYKIDISNGGTERWQLQLLQNGLPLFHGEKYKFEFTVGSTEVKVIEAHIGKNGSPWTNYGKIGPTAINDQIKKYSYEFTMNDNTDPDARVVINWGLNTGTFFLEEVKLTQLPITGIDESSQTTPETFALYQNYPNPFNPATNIKYTLPNSEKVKIEVFNMLGQKTETLLNKLMPAGTHQIEFTVKNLPSGIYLYRIKAGEFHDIKKMIILK